MFLVAVALENEDGLDGFQLDNSWCSFLVLRLLIDVENKIWKTVSLPSAGLEGVTLPVLRQSLGAMVTQENACPLFGQRQVCVQTSFNLSEMAQLLSAQHSAKKAHYQPAATALCPHKRSPTKREIKPPLLESTPRSGRTGSRFACQCKRGQCFLEFNIELR